MSIKPEFPPPTSEMKSAVSVLNESLRSLGETIGFLANTSMEARQFFEEAANLQANHEGLFHRFSKERLSFELKV